MTTHAPPPDTASARAASLAGLEWPRLLGALAGRLATPYGREALAALAPLAGLEAIRHRLACLDEMKALRTARGSLAFGAVHALTGLLERAQRQGRLEAAELAMVLATQRCALHLRAALLSAQDAPRLAELAGGLEPLRGLVEQLAQALTPAGTLNEQAYPELRRLRDEIAGRRDAIHRRLEGLLRSKALADAIQDSIYTLRGRRYVLPVKADFKGHLSGIVHDVSASGATLFMEPQAVVEDTNALTLTERLLELEQDRILRELSAQVGAAAPALHDNLRWIGALDLLHAQATLSEAYAGIAPVVEQEGSLALRGLAHPLLLLERARASGAAEGAPPSAQSDAAAEFEPHPAGVVRNDVHLGGATRCMVISGANTGGKTVLLKAVGLAAELVRHGMHVPALAGSRCDAFAAVWADIGDQQSLEASLSTFSAQIRFLTQWLPQAVPGHLVLLDELLTGTEPAQGAALGTVVLEHLLERGATVLVTTHFGELKELAARQPGVVNASMAFDLERMQPTFRLAVGLPGASYALHIARRYGLADALVQRAEVSLAARPAALDALLVDYHAQARRQAEAAERLQAREARLREAETALAESRDALNARERDLRRRDRGAVSAELRTARRRIGEVMRELQQANSLPTVSRVRDRLAALQQEHDADGVESTAPALRAPEGLQPGAPVWLPSLGRPAELEALLDDGRRARVRLGALTMEVAREALAAQPAAGSGLGGSRGGRRGAVGPPPDAPVGAPSEGSPIAFALATEDNTLDVRGLRLEDALSEVERFFDLCTMKHVSPVLVIHGHGTGRLKAGLRESWGSSPYVAAYRPGAEGEGRDGVSIVALNL